MQPADLPLLHSTHHALSCRHSSHRLRQAGPTEEWTVQGIESFISVEMGCEGRLASSPIGSCMAGGPIFISNSGVGVAMLVALDRKTGCQGCQLDKDSPNENWEPYSQDNSVVLPFYRSDQTGGRDATYGNDMAPTDIVSQEATGFSLRRRITQLTSLPEWGGMARD